MHKIPECYEFRILHKDCLRTEAWHAFVSQSFGTMHYSVFIAMHTLSAWCYVRLGTYTPLLRRLTLLNNLTFAQDYSEGQGP